MSETKNIQSVKLSAATQTIYPESKFVECKVKNGSLITYGNNNLFPQYLDALYDNNSLHSGICNKKISYVYGNGLYSETGSAPLTEFIDKCNSKNDSLNTVYRRLVEDYIRYGGMAVEVVNNRLGEMQDIYYVDSSKLRLSGSEDKILYSRDWSQRIGKVKYTQYDSYVPGQSGSASSIFWYKGNTRGYYPKPQYNGGLMGIEQLTELDKFSLSTIQNGFFPSLMITFNQSATEEQKEDTEQSMLEKWGGTTQAGKIILNFAGEGETAPVIAPIAQPDVVSQFDQQRQNAIDSIFMGHQISSRQIFGIETPGKLGTSKDFAEGTEIFTQDFVKPVQKELMEVLNQLLSVRFPKPDLAVKQIEPIGSAFENELAMVANMTQDEYRGALKLQGVIDNVEIPKGSIMATLPLRGDTTPGELPEPGKPTGTPDEIIETNDLKNIK